MYQREDRELFRSWMDGEVRAGGSPTAPAPPTHMPVQKMGPQDDPEAFLDLCGEVQLAAQQLPVQNLLVYDDLKRAILQRVGRSPEQHCQCFRSLELGENGRPFAMAHQLRDACRRRRRRADHRPCGAGTMHCAASQEDRAVGPVPPAVVAGPGHPTHRGPDGGAPRGWRNPTVRLSLSPLPFFFSPYLPA